MISVSDIKKSAVRNHYDLVTPFYRLLWGEHIHHGLWHADESPRVAQRQLVSTMASLAEIVPGDRVLDVGCGMGGSSIQLAREAGCMVTGVTLSPLQRLWAAAESRWRGVREETRFLCTDAERVDFAPQSFDVVWSIECTEHLFDKPAFFRRAASWLRPGGRMVICAWLAAGDELDASKTQQVRDVCEGFLCPSLGSANDYQRWMTDAGLTPLGVHDWTEQTTRTWEICLERVRQSRVRWLAKMVPGMIHFLDTFETILAAYRSGAMSYGCFVFQAAPVERSATSTIDLGNPAVADVT